MDEARRTGSPAFAGDDGSGPGELFPVIARRASAEAIQPSPFAAPRSAEYPSALRARYVLSFSKGTRC